MLSMSSVLFASTGLWFLHDVIGLSPRAIFVVAAVSTIAYVLTTLTISREIRSHVFITIRTIGRLLSTHLPLQIDWR
jgi:hypothetical protein